MAPSIEAKRYGAEVGMQVKDGLLQNKAAFHDRFRDHAARIMRTYGFQILGMWEAQTDTRTEFVYLLAWPDAPTMRRAWDRFRADEEWKEIKRVTSAQPGGVYLGNQLQTRRA